jgi:hypothetical protein
MTKAYLVLKDMSDVIMARAGEQLIMGESSAGELNMTQLEADGFVKLMTDAEALAHHQGGK